MDNLEAIDYNKILSNPDISSIVKMTALKLMANPYLSPGEFFRGLSNNDLTILNFMVEMIHTDEQCQMDLVCLSEMLSRAEGTESYDIQGQSQNVNILGVMITAVSLERKGLVEVMYENLSFGDDMIDKPIVNLKQ